jgi:hypothetical protein
MALSKIELLAGLLEIVVIERRRHFSIGSVPIPVEK